MLTTYAGKLLRVGQQLALSAYCCCTGRWCQTFFDECGNMFKKCVAINTGVECNANCGPPPRDEPCECGPNKPCPACFECIDGKCVRIEDCCADGTPCPPCHKCDLTISLFPLTISGKCVPCGECEQCIDGFCLPCGPCQTCVDGECVPCPEDCVGGVCTPYQYYCCYDECPGGEDQYGNPLPPPSTHCQPYPCGIGEDQNGEDCDLTKGGPYSTINLCQQNCQKYKCVLDACGFGQCVPAPDGGYASLSECLAGCEDDPCSGPCTFTGASAPGTYSIDACERDICVSYVSPDSRPIRVQIWGPTLDANCNVIASDVIKADSGWRGEECCDCESRPGGALAGGPKGQITWNKPRGVTSFRVAVLTACSSSANITIACSDQCFEYPDPEMCPCADDGDCAEGCSCCNGRCRQAPCECETDDDCPCWAVDTYPATDNLGNPINPDCAQIAESSGDQWLFCGPNAEAQANAEAARRYTDPAYAGCDHTTNAAGNAWCCNGTCKSACRDCAWPGDRFETSIPCTVAACCGFPIFLSNSRNQSLSQALPNGITWKAGYPALLDECNYRWCTDTAIGVCYDADGNTCRFITKTRYKLLAIDCDTQTVVDKTNDAATGVFETTSPGACTDGPNFPAFFSTPELVCLP